MYFGDAKYLISGTGTGICPNLFYICMCLYGRLYRHQERAGDDWLGKKDMLPDQIWEAWGKKQIGEFKKNKEWVQWNKRVKKETVGFVETSWPVAASYRSREWRFFVGSVRLCVGIFFVPDTQKFFREKTCDVSNEKLPVVPAQKVEN
jgi:hypothetical protein